MQNADPIIINYLRSLFLEAEDETELKFETDEETPKMFIPKLFCQVEDEKNGWHSKTVERYATLLLMILNRGSLEILQHPPSWRCLPQTRHGISVPKKCGNVLE